MNSVYVNHLKDQHYCETRSTCTRSLDESCARLEAKAHTPNYKFLEENFQRITYVKYNPINITTFACYFSFNVQCYESWAYVQSCLWPPK